VQLHLSRIETAVFLALTALSMFLFFRALSPVLTNIRGAKRDPGFIWGSAGKRLANCVWEVLLQGKVIQERPLPGLGHAFVFWGFLAFAVVTLDHGLAGVGADLVRPDSVVGRFYFWLAAVFAGAVTLSMLGLAIRRFVVRPRWLGPFSAGSALITVLILTLMITFLLGWAYLPEDTAAGRINWWVHTLALLAFLPVIPKTKHLHLLLSPATIFFRRGSFSLIPPLEGDEDFGLRTGKDITNIVALQAYSCVECGRCTQHCPANNTGKLLDPKQVILGVRQYLREHGPASDTPIVGQYVPEKMLWQCTSCGACEYQCPVGIEHLPVIIGMRRGLVNTGAWDDPHGNKLFLQLERSGNSLGFQSSERDKFIQQANLPIYDGSQEYCLWLGCMGAYDAGGRETIVALAELLRFLNVSFGVLARERCCGDPVRRLGNDLLLEMLAEYNGEQIRSQRVVRMLSICPHCVRTIAEDWKQFGVSVHVEHHAEFLARHVGRLPQDKHLEATVAFHDPCYLGRYRDVYEAPRRVVDRTARVQEPPRTQQRGFCCGAGGGRMFLGEEEGKRVNVERADELVGTGASIIGAACPFCKTMFRDALGQTAADSPRLLDIAQIAAASLPKPAPDARITE
jgi:Fe-S oxidoreductase